MWCLLHFVQIYLLTVCSTRGKLYISSKLTIHCNKIQVGSRRRCLTDWSDRFAVMPSRYNRLVYHVEPLTTNSLDRFKFPMRIFYSKWMLSGGWSVFGADRLFQVIKTDFWIRTTEKIHRIFQFLVCLKRQLEYQRKINLGLGNVWRWSGIAGRDYRH